MKLKYKQAILVVTHPIGGERLEPAIISRVTEDMLPLPAGYHPVRFTDGGCVLIHESAIRLP